MTPPVTLTARAAGPGREPFLPRGRTALSPRGRSLYRPPAPAAGLVAERTSGWGLGAPGVYAEVSPPSSGWSLARPGEPFHLTAGRVLIAFRAVARVEAAIAVAQAADLALVRRRRLYHRLGYSSFADFAREFLQMSPRSAGRRVALHHVFERAPAVRHAFMAGRLSECQALALAPVTADDALPFWIERASSVAVRELERRIRAERREPSDATTSAEADEPGRVVTFTAPRSASIAWEQGMELARRVLGYEAPRYRCVEAILDETWADLCAMAPGTPPGDEDHGGVRRRKREESGAENTDEPATAADPGTVPTSGDGPGGSGPSGVNSSSCGVDPSTRPVVTPSTARWRELVDALAATECELTRVESLASSPCISGDPAVSPDRLAAELGERWRALGRAERPLRVLMARLLRAAHRAGALRALGYSSLAGFVEGALGLSERTGRRFMAEAFLFEDEPALARAYAAGEIGLAHAWLIRGVALSDTRAAFLRRARGVTALQFEREVRFLEGLREFIPSLAADLPGPLPLPGLERALIERLRGLGWEVSQVQRALAARQATLDGWEAAVAVDKGVSASGGVTPAGAEAPYDEDPGRKPLAMRRLEILLELLVLAMEEHDRRVREGVGPAAGACGENQSPCGRAGDAFPPVTPDEAPTTLSESVRGADAPTMAGSGGVAGDTDRPLLARFEMEPGGAGAPVTSPLPTLAQAAGLDLGSSMTTVSFWAPAKVLMRWHWAVSTVQGDSGLPAWTAAMLLLDAAVGEWERAGRVRRPAGWRILERDGWRCRTPGCSARKALEVHHIVFRSHGGGNEPGNLLTLCHHHHQHGVHGGTGP